MTGSNITEQVQKKPAQKCVGFTRKIGNTNYEVEGFYSESGQEALETTIKRLIRDEADAERHRKFT